MPLQLPHPLEEVFCALALCELLWCGDGAAEVAKFSAGGSGNWSSSAFILTSVSSSNELSPHTFSLSINCKSVGFHDFDLRFMMEKLLTATADRSMQQVNRRSPASLSQLLTMQHNAYLIFYSIGELKYCTYCVNRKLTWLPNWNSTYSTSFFLFWH